MSKKRDVDFWISIGENALKTNILTGRKITDVGLKRTTDYDNSISENELEQPAEIKLLLEKFTNLTG